MTKAYSLNAYSLIMPSLHAIRPWLGSRVCFATAFVTAIVILFGGCRQAEVPSTTSGSKPQVYAVNYPLEYFARRIGGRLVEVHFPVPAEVDPAYWQPGEAVVESFQQADLILLNGASYAKWTERHTLPPRKTVNTSQAFKDQWLPIKNAVVHQHGPEGKHAHQGTAFTTWLNLHLAIQQAEAVQDALVTLLPEHSDQLQANFAELKDDLLDLDVGLDQIAKHSEVTPLLASHPVYQYLEQRLNLNLVSLHWEPDQMPDEEEWNQLKELLKDHAAHWMLWEAQPLEEIAERLERMEITPVVYRPCGNRPESGDFLEVMRINVERLKPVFEPRVR